MSPASNPDPIWRRSLELVQADLSGTAATASLASLAEALEALARRRAHDTFLPTSSDPAWLMLLALFGAQARAEQRSVSDLCAISGAPLTTAFRIVLRLEDRRFVTRTPDPRDHRRSLVALSERTQVAMSDALGGVQGALRSQSD